MHHNMVLILILFSLSFIRWGMVFPLVPLLARDLGASAAMIGIIVGAFSLFSFLLSIPIGGLADRFRTKRTFFLGVLCNMASVLLLLHATHTLTLIVSQVLGGFGFQLNIVSAQLFVACFDSPLERESGFGYLTFSAALGQSLGPVMGGVIASRFGYQIAFLTAFVISTSGLLILGLREPSRPRAAERYSLGQDLRHAGVLLSDLRMVAVLLFTFVVLFAVSLRTSFLPVLLLNRGSSEAVAGLLISLLAGASTLIRPFMGKLLQIFSRRSLLAFCALTVALGVGLIPVLSSAWAAALAICTFGLGFGLTQPLSILMVADLSGAEHSGLGLGIRFLSITLANLLGPVLLGALVEPLGLDAAFYVSAFIVAAIAAYILFWKPELIPGRREEV